jgi:hypothetical protein
VASRDAELDDPTVAALPLVQGLFRLVLCTESHTERCGQMVLRLS